MIAGKSINRSTIFLYFGILVVGFFLGRQLPSVFDDASLKSEETAIKDQQEHHSSNKGVGTTDHDELESKEGPISIVEEDIDNNKNPSNKVLTADTMMDELAGRDHRDFRSTHMYKETREHFANNPELAIDLLERLLDIDDPELRFRVSSVLQNHTIQPDPADPKTLRPAVDWVMQQIKSDIRTDEWLGILANWGATTKESADHLLGMLHDTNSNTRTRDVLRALIRSNHAGYPQISKFSTDERAEYARRLEPYLIHKDHEIRQSALETLNAFSNENMIDHVVRGLEDPNEKVRLSALSVIGGRKLLTPEISTKLIGIIQNKQRSAQEKVFSYHQLKQYNLNSDNYRTVYDFASSELELLELEIQQERSSRTQANRSYYEF